MTPGERVVVVLTVDEVRAALVRAAVPKHEGLKDLPRANLGVSWIAYPDGTVNVHMTYNGDELLEDAQQVTITHV